MASRWNFGAAVEYTTEQRCPRRPVRLLLRRASKARRSWCGLRRTTCGLSKGRRSLCRLLKSRRRRRAAVVDASNTVLLSCQINANVSLCKQQTVSVEHGNSRAQKRIRQHRGPLADTWRRLAVARTWHSTPLIAHAQTDSRSWSIHRRCGQWRLRTGSRWQVWRNGGMPVPREHVRSRAWRLDRASI